MALSVATNEVTEGVRTTGGARGLQGQLRMGLAGRAPRHHAFALGWIVGIARAQASRAQARALAVATRGGPLHEAHTKDSYEMRQQIKAPMEASEGVRMVPHLRAPPPSKCFAGLVTGCRRAPGELPRPRAGGGSGAV